MTAYDSSNANTQIKASGDTVRIASEVVDFSSTTNAATDTFDIIGICLLYTSPSPRDQRGSRMPSSA